MTRFLLGLLLAVLASSSAAIAQQPVPASAQALDTGVELYRSRSYDKAVDALKAVVSSDKKNKQAWLYLGASYVKLGKEDEAARAFRSSEFTYRDASSKLDTDLKVKRKPRASYTERARQNNTSGEVRVAVEFKADGTIGFVFPFQSLPDGLTENVIRAAKETEFEPAVKDGKPVDVISVMVYSFAIY